MGGIQNEARERKPASAKDDGRKSWKSNLIENLII
jgi:hypothetical protein